MNAKNILGIVTAFFVFVTAVSGHTTTSHKKYSAYFSGAHQKGNNSAEYQPPRSPGYNVLTGS